MTTPEFSKLIEAAGYPAGVVNIIPGAAATGRALAQHRDVNKISFTGSLEIGRKIAETDETDDRNLVPVTVELGGMSRNIVFADADLDRAITGSLAGIFGATGQTCIAGSRLLVQQSVYGRVAEELKSRAESIVFGHPTDVATEMGTIANEPQCNRILDRIASARKEGARLVTDGERASGPLLDAGLLRPTILADMDSESSLPRKKFSGLSLRQAQGKRLRFRARRSDSDGFRAVQERAD